LLVVMFDNYTRLFTRYQIYERLAVLKHVRELYHIKNHPELFAR